MKRWFLASAIFVGSLLVLLALAADTSYREISAGQATGFGLTPFA